MRARYGLFIMRYYTATQLSENMFTTPEGYLLCVGVPIARTGAMEYAAHEVPFGNGDGTVVVLRSEDVVFDPETISSFEGKSVTVDHPDEFVTPETWRELTVGLAQNVRRGVGEQRDLLLADLLITDKEAIALVRGGLREISCGYDAEYEGLGPNMGRQVDIRGNHIALVHHGRCGARCKINDKETPMGSKSTKGKAGFWDRLLSKPGFKKAMDEALEEERTSAKDESETEAGKDSPDEVEQQATDEDGLERIAAGVEEIKIMLRALVEGQGKTADEGAAEDEGQAQDEDQEQEDEPEQRPTGDRALSRPASTGRTGKSARTADSDTLRRAAVLAPALRFRTGDSACTVKRAALRMAMGDAALEKVISSCLRGQSLDKADRVTVDAAFIAASELAAVGNNRRTADALTRATTKDFGKAVTPADINRMNREYHDKAQGK